MKHSLLYTLAFLFAITVSFPILLDHDGKASAYPQVDDPSLQVQTYIDGIRLPSNIAFLGPDDLLVLEKDTGIVRRISNGTMYNSSLLELNVSSEKWSMERGLLGIAIGKNTDVSPHVFIYLTEFEKINGEDSPIGNRLYKYELKDDKLVNRSLLLDLPSYPGDAHNGGAVVIGPDNNVYLSVGDVWGQVTEETKTQAQNFADGPVADGRAGILHFSQEGKPLGEGILGTEYPSNLYYAYGIRNSFGMDFDPITGYLWDTENGPLFADEINLVKPGFNSGWMSIQGIWKPDPTDINHPSNARFNSDDLVDFGGRGEYSDPEFIWNNTVGPTALKFLHSDKLGKEYENDMFVADVNQKNIYRFDLNEDRTELLLNGPLKDGIANSHQELKEIIFASGFGRITDIEVGPDGYLYVVSYREDRENPFEFEGTIHRIVPRSLLN